MKGKRYSDLYRQITGQGRSQAEEQTATLRSEYGENWEQSDELSELMLFSDCLPSKVMFGGKSDRR